MTFSGRVAFRAFMIWNYGFLFSVLVLINRLIIESLASLYRRQKQRPVLAKRIREEESVTLRLVRPLKSTKSRF